MKNTTNSRKRNALELSQQRQQCEPHIDVSLFGFASESKNNRTDAHALHGGSCASTDNTAVAEHVFIAVPFESEPLATARRALHDRLQHAQHTAPLCVCASDDVAVTGTAQFGACVRRPHYLELARLAMPGHVAFQHNNALLAPRHW